MARFVSLIRGNASPVKASADAQPIAANALRPAECLTN